MPTIRSSEPAPVVVIGIGADGWDGLSAAARSELRAAELIVGGPRQLALLPAELTADRVPWPSPMMPALPGLLAERHTRRLVVLASGDPMFYGVGTSIVAELGAAAVRVLPALSSATLAGARLGWPGDRTEVLSLVARPVAALRRRLQTGRRLLVLLGSPDQVAEVASVLTEVGFGASTLTVLSQLGGPAEAVVSGTAAAWTAPAPDPLSVLAIAVRADAGAAEYPTTPGLPEAAYRQDGQITKHQIRAVTVAALAPLPGQLLWDVGAGSGSVGIEWLRAEPSGRAIAVEPRPDRLADLRTNADALGVPGLRIVAGTAPEALTGLPSPDAIFVGGGVSVPGVLEACLDALPPGGRLVANGVTVQTELVLGRWHGELGGELSRLAVQHAEPVGRFTGWRPAMPVTQWSYRRGAVS